MAPLAAFCLQTMLESPLVTSVKFGRVFKYIQNSGEGGGAPRVVVQIGIRADAVREHLCLRHQAWVGVQVRVPPWWI